MRSAMSGVGVRIGILVFAGVVAGVVAVATSAQEDDLKPEVIEKIRAALPESAPAKPARPRKVLIFTKTNGFRHGSIPVAVRSLAMLGEKTGAYSAVHSEDDAMFEKEKLAEFDAVFMINTTGPLFRPRKMPSEENEKNAALEREKRLQQNLVDFVKSGKGIAGTHSATDTYKQWDEYNEMIGGAFDGHPWHTEVPIANLEPKHPVNAAFGGEGFRITDEIYQFRENTALPTGRRMLLALDGEKMDLAKGKRGDGLYPISWISSYGKGRAFYCSLGHRDEIYWNPAVLKHYLAGFQYALGDLEADATPTR